MNRVSALDSITDKESIEENQNKEITNILTRKRTRRQRDDEPLLSLTD